MNHDITSKCAASTLEIGLSCAIIVPFRRQRHGYTDKFHSPPPSGKEQAITLK